MLHKVFLFIIYFVTLLSTTYGCMSSKPTDSPIVSTTTSATITSSTTTSPKCQKKDNKVMVYLDPSVNAANVPNPAIAGSKTGTRMFFLFYLVKKNLL